MGRGWFGVGQSTFALWGKRTDVILPGISLALDDFFQRYCDPKGNDNGEECAVTEALEGWVQIVHLELTDRGGVPSEELKRPEGLTGLIEASKASKAEEVQLARYLGSRQLAPWLRTGFHDLHGCFMND